MRRILAPHPVNYIHQGQLCSPPITQTEPADVRSTSLRHNCGTDLCRWICLLYWPNERPFPTLRPSVLAETFSSESAPSSQRDFKFDESLRCHHSRTWQGARTGSADR